MVRITFEDAVAKVWPDICYISGSDMSYFRTLLRRKSQVDLGILQNHPFIVHSLEKKHLYWSV